MLDGSHRDSRAAAREGMSVGYSLCHDITLQSLTMPLLTVRQAADHVGVARQTMFSYIKSGRVSATVDPHSGEKRIDISELLRVFGDRPKTDRPTTASDHTRQSEVTPGAVALQIEVATLRAQLEARAAEVAMLKDRVAELKDREHQGDQERQKLLALLEQSQRLLTVQPPPKTQSQVAVLKSKKSKKTQQAKD